jgi:hypothetical protein
MTDTALAVGGGMAAVAAAAAAAAGGVLARGTTAVPAAGWTVAACLAVAWEFAWRAVSAAPDPATAAAVRLGVTALSVCPIISLLGAKRPQHGVWQFIVASLGVVLALPAATALLVRPGDPPDVLLAERLLVLAVVLVAWLNYLGTRRGWAATLITGGHLLYVRDIVPFPVGRPGSVTIDAVAAAVVAIGAGLAVARALGRAAGGRASAGHPAGAAGSLRAEVEPAFLAVRETFGAAWALRIVERFNAVAATRGWPCRLAFGGVVQDVEDADIRAAATRTLGAILRRFVDTDWLRRHGWRAAPEPTPAARGRMDTPAG